MNGKQARNTDDHDRFDQILDGIEELWERFFRGFLLGSLILFLFRAFVTG